MIQSTFTLLVIPLLLWFDNYVSAKVYYATPTCPEGNVSCMTLSQYATQPNNYFTSNTTLILLPGNHSLDSELKVTNITHLTISAFLPDTKVTCYQLVGFIFEEIGHVNISGITFVGCVNNSITSVEHLTVGHCIFDGQYREWTGLDFNTAFNVTILNSYFTKLNNKGGKLLGHEEYPDEPSLTGGGAIFVNNSDVFISHCVFSGNIVNNEWNNSDGGGAIYIMNSNVSVDDCQLINNSANGCSGGAVYVVIDSSSVVVTFGHSRFINNDGESNGGAVFVYNFDKSSVALTIYNSTFINNVGGVGSAVYVLNDQYSARLSVAVTIHNSTFVNNTADVRGAVGVYNSDEQSNVAVILYNSTFINNKANYSGAVSVHDTSVIIDNCMFINNTCYSSAAYCTSGAVGVEGVVDRNITINSSTFINNTASSDGGAVFFSCDYGGYGDIVLIIDNSIFLNNGASNGGGGGLYCSSINYYCRISAILTNVTFNNNSAVHGAAIYLAYCDLSSDGYLNIDSNVANSSVVYAQVSKVSLSGATTVSNNIGSVFVFNSNVTLSGNAIFMNNNHTSDFLSGIQEGGAITSFQSNLYFHNSVNMLNNKAENGGAILARESKVYMYGNITIADNRALQSGGGIYAFQTEFNIDYHSVTISGNKADKKGGGINAISSTIKVLKYSLQFISNNAERGGGVCLELNAKLYISKSQCKGTNDVGLSCTNTWSRIVFTKNFADYGGAVYVTDDTNYGTCSATPSTEQSATSECFFQVVALYKQIVYDDEDIISWTSSITSFGFINNTARVAGGTLFGGLLDRCAVSPFAEVFQMYPDLSPDLVNAMSYLFNVSNLEESDLMISDISSFPVRVCFCNDNQPDCSYQPPPKHVLKGSVLKVSVVAVDQVDNTVPNTIIHSSLSSGDGRLSDGQAVQQTKNSCTELQYNAFSPNDNETLLLYAEGPCNDTGISSGHIYIKFQDCPIGFNSTTGDKCSCDPALSPYITNNCFIDNQTVLREGDFWITYMDGSDKFLIKPHCPFDYCHPHTDKVYINFSIPNGTDTQCAFNRSGILCGNCSENLSLSLGSSRCMSCSNDGLALIVPFAIAGIALVAFLLMFNLTVAIGTINGLIFYANIIAANRSIFLPFDKTNFLTVFIAWLNLDIGFETCFYDGMDGYAKVWLQLVFPCYIILLVTTVIIVCENSRPFSKLLSYTNPVESLATLILLSYAKLLRIIIAALSFTTLEYPQANGSHKIIHKVWLYDANITYLEGKHIPLFIAAVLILLVGLVYTFLLIFWQLILKFFNEQCVQSMANNNATLRIHRWYIGLQHFIDMYHAPYNSSHRYWTGLLLLLRGVLYLISAVFGDPSISLLSIACAIALLLIWKLIAQRIYKRVYISILDTIFLANLVTFTVGTLYIRVAGSGNQAALAYTSTSIAFITFTGILCYHIKGMAKYLYQFGKKKIQQHHDCHHLSIRAEECGTVEEHNHKDSENLLSPDYSETEINGLPDTDEGTSTLLMNTEEEDERKI